MINSNTALCINWKFTQASLHWLHNTFKNHHDNDIISYRCNFVLKLCNFPISLAFTPMFCHIQAQYPYTVVSPKHCVGVKNFASGKRVGLLTERTGWRGIQQQVESEKPPATSFPPPPMELLSVASVQSLLPEVQRNLEKGAETAY